MNLLNLCDSWNILEYPLVFHKMGYTFRRQLVYRSGILKG